MNPGEITQLLVRWRSGEPGAFEQLVHQVYGELHRISQRYMSRESGAHTLQATALVHEAYARIVGADVEFRDRAHFLAVMANVMRRILVDHAKAKHRAKRGGRDTPISLEDVATFGAEPDPAMLDLDEAIQALGRHDPRKEKVVELHYFGGLTQPEIAEALGISPATVDRDLRMARAWLRKELQSA